MTLITQQPPAGSIEGVVTQIGTDQPVVRAVIELSGEGREPAVLAAGADGRFVFRNLAPGRYQLRASRDGYIPGAYGRRGPNGRGVTLTLQAGQAVKDVQLTMVPLGALSGRVFDSNGDPVTNATVRALKSSFTGGQRTFTAVKTAQTDDRGEYRLFWLPPGDYYISAAPAGSGVEDDLHVVFAMAEEPGMPRDSRNGGSALDRLGQTLVPTYYPGTSEGQAAASLKVRTGSDLGGVDFILTRAAPRAVRGVVIDGTTGQPAANASVTLVPRGGIGRSIVAIRESDGSFRIQNVLPGSYYLVTTARIPAGGSSFRIMGGRTAVDVADADIDRLVVSVLPSIDIPGQVVVEGSLNVPVNLHPVIALKNELTNVPGRFVELFASFSEDDRRFVINDAIEGDYNLRLTDVPPGTYVKSARFGSADVLNGRLQLSSRSTDRLEVVLATNPGVLEGIAVDKNRQPVANVTVALVPDAARRLRSDVYRNATTDESGRFRLLDIPPGVYFVFAWEDIEDGLWRDPEFIRANEGTGRLVRINENGRETVELTAIPFAY